MIVITTQRYHFAYFQFCVWFTMSLNCDVKRHSETGTVSRKAYAVTSFLSFVSVFKKIRKGMSSGRCWLICVHINVVMSIRSEYFHSVKYLPNRVVERFVCSIFWHCSKCHLWAVIMAIDSNCSIDFIARQLSMNRLLSEGQQNTVNINTEIHTL